MNLRPIVRRAAVAAVMLIAIGNAHGDNPFAWEPPEDRGTARERLAAYEERTARGVTPQTNAARHLLIYMTAPDFRDEEFQDEVETLEVVTPLAVLPFFREWHTFVMGELDENAETRRQYDMARRGVFNPGTAPDVAIWLEDVGPAMDAMRDAVALPHFSLPILNPDWPESTFLRARQEYRYAGLMLRNVAEAFLVRCHYHLGLSDDANALADLVAADRMAKHLSHHLDAWALEESYQLSYSTNRTLTLLLESGVYRDEELAALMDQWDRPYTGHTPIEVIDQWERLWLIDYFERVASGEEEDPAFFLRIMQMGHPPEDEEAAGWDWMMRHELFDTQRAIARVDERYDWLVETLEADDFPSQMQAATEVEEALRGRMGRLNVDWGRVERFYQQRRIPDGMTRQRFTDAIVDSALVLLMHPNRVMDPALEQYAAAAYQRLGITAIALERYRLEHASYPDTLAALVPAYLPAVPIDPYNDGRAIRYRLLEGGDGFELRSVGMDQADEEGEGDDLLLTVE